MQRHSHTQQQCNHRLACRSIVPTNETAALSSQSGCIEKRRYHFKVQWQCSPILFMCNVALKEFPLSHEKIRFKCHSFLSGPLKSFVNISEGNS